MVVMPDFLVSRKDFFHSALALWCARGRLSCDGGIKVIISNMRERTPCSVRQWIRGIKESIVRGCNFLPMVTWKRNLVFCWFLFLRQWPYDEFRLWFWLNNIFQVVKGGHDSKHFCRYLDFRLTTMTPLNISRRENQKPGKLSQFKNIFSLFCKETIVK